MEINEQTINRLLELGRSQAPPVNLGGDTVMVLPQGFTALNVSQFCPPQRIRQAVNLTTPEAFAAYVNRFKDSDTLIFAKVTDTEAAFRAVLDYHVPPSLPREPKDPDAEDDGAYPPLPRYCSHTATYAVEHTTEWKRWLAANGKKFTQEEFALWLEENQDLLVSPSGADLLELVVTLEGKSDVRFSSAIRLQNRKSTLLFDEDVALSGGSTTKSGKLEVPGSVLAAIAPFHGVAKCPSSARLKYRIDSRRLTFWLEIVSPHLTIREAVAGVLEAVKTATALPVLMGTP
jgi:hypothetical protein